MKIYEIEANEKVDLVINYNGKKLNFQSIVYGAKGNELLIESIRVNGKLLNLDIGKLTLSIIFNRKDNKPLLWSNCDFKMSVFKKKIYITVSNKYDGVELNRRNNFRLSIGDEGKTKIGKDRDVLEMILKNVSYSGFAILVDKNPRYEIGMDVEIAYRDVQLNTVLRLQGKIVRFEENDDKRVLLGCKLNNPNPALGKYIKDKQQVILAKRSGMKIN